MDPLNGMSANDKVEFYIESGQKSDNIWMKILSGIGILFHKPAQLIEGLTQIAEDRYNYVTNYNDPKLASAFANVTTGYIVGKFGEGFISGYSSARIALKGSGEVEFKGKTVTQNNNLFDPKAVDKQGRTNIQRMEEGLAPIGHDGKSVNVHHTDQTNNGPLMEISGSSHQQGYSNLHQNTGQSPSLIDRNKFNQWRNDYWEWRSNDFK